MDSFLDRLFSLFRGPKEEEATAAEEHTPHEAVDELGGGREERFHDFEHERRAPYGAPEEHEAERLESDVATFAGAAGLKMKKEHEA